MSYPLNTTSASPQPRFGAGIQASLLERQGARLARLLQQTIPQAVDRFVAKAVIKKPGINPLKLTWNYFANGHPTSLAGPLTRIMLPFQRL